MKILIYGYYSKNNFGDDLFEIVFKKHFAKLDHDIYITSPPKLKNITADIDIIICGGGDIINEYFMRAIIAFKRERELTYNKYIPIYAVSVGLTYPGHIKRDIINYMDIFDHCIVRNKHDYLLLLERYGSSHVDYLPDLAFLLHDAVRIPSPRQNRIGIFLARPIYKDGANTYYENFVTNMIELINTLSKTHHIDLISSDYSGGDNNDDNILNQQICDAIDNKHKITIINASDQYKIIELVSTYEYTICMRYHAHIISYISKTPFISLCMTNKVKYFMEDNGLSDYMIILNKSENDISLPSLNIIYQKISILLHSTPTYDIPALSFDDYINKILCQKIRRSSPTYFHENDLKQKYNDIMTNIISAIYKLNIHKTKISYDVNTIIIKCTNIRDICNMLCVSEESINDEKIKNILSSVVDYTLTNKYQSEYFCGINEKLYDMSIKDSVKWVTNHMHYNNVHKNYVDIVVNKEKFNMNYIESFSMDGVHRAGWKYVTDEMYKVCHNENGDIILDMCCDATFHWNQNILSLVGKLPYKKPWAGIIHHTPNTSYTYYNATMLLSNQIFIESLKSCVCIVVLSEYMRAWFLDNFKKMNIFVEVICVYHPTEFIDNNFSMDKFILNENKMVVQVGGWMRNSYAIYALQINKNILQINKGALIGKMMDNYFKPSDFDLKKIITDYETNKMDCPTCRILKEISNYITYCTSHYDSHCIPKCMINVISKCISDYVSHNQQYDNCISNGVSNGLSNCISGCITYRNKYIQGIIDNVDDNYKSVTTINRLSNDEYDEMLTKNIVFLNLVDASACNTLIECVVRNCPIIINKLPAIVEILGETYPLYYDTLIEASHLATSIADIANAYKYLCFLDKSKLRIDYFINDFKNKVTAIAYKQKSES